MFAAAKGRKIPLPPNGSVLRTACSLGSLPCAKLLLQHGAAVNVVDERGFSALMFAAAKGRADCVKELLENGADPCAMDNFGNPANWHAQNGGHHDVENILSKARIKRCR